MIRSIVWPPQQIRIHLPVDFAVAPGSIIGELAANLLNSISRSGSMPSGGPSKAGYCAVAASAAANRTHHAMSARPQWQRTIRNDQTQHPRLQRDRAQSKVEENQWARPRPGPGEKRRDYGGEACAVSMQAGTARKRLRQLAPSAASQACDWQCYAASRARY